MRRNQNWVERDNPNFGKERGTREKVLLEVGSQLDFSNQFSENTKYDMGSPTVILMIKKKL